MENSDDIRRRMHGQQYMPPSHIPPHMQGQGSFNPQFPPQHPLQHPQPPMPPRPTASHYPRKKSRRFFLSSFIFAVVIIVGTWWILSVVSSRLAWKAVFLDTNQIYFARFVDIPFASTITLHDVHYMKTGTSNTGSAGGSTSSSNSSNAAAAAAAAETKAVIAAIASSGTSTASTTGSSTPVTIITSPPRQTTAQTTSKLVPQPSLTVVPITNDLHGPKSIMVVRKSHVLYYQELREDSVLHKGLEDSLK